MSPHNRLTFTSYELQNIALTEMKHYNLPFFWLLVQAASLLKLSAEDSVKHLMLYHQVFWGKTYFYCSHVKETKDIQDT